MLREHGHIAYFAGGCVRDQLLGFEPKDWDVATTATTPEIQTIFRRTHCVGQAFGVVLVVTLGHSIEVTTFRAESGYSDKRRPDQVRYAGPEEDAGRRDFTINGLFQDPQSGEVIDLVGGQEDLKRKTIRAIGDPQRRFAEDHLRMLRAVRFAARFGFTIEPATEAAIRANPRSLDGVSRERIGQEVEWMLAHPSRATAVRLMESLGLDGVVLNERSHISPRIRLDAIGGEGHHPVALAAWWLDRHGDDANPPDPRKWRSALVLSNGATDEFLGTLDSVRAVQYWAGVSIAKRKRQAARSTFQPALTLVAAVDWGLARMVEDEFQALHRSGLQPAPFIDGEDLLEMGLSQGPQFGRILAEVYDAQLEGRVASRLEARELANRLART